MKATEVWQPTRTPGRHTRHIQDVASAAAAASSSARVRTLALGAVSVLGATIAGFDGATPTEWGPADTAWRIGIGGLLVICGAFAPPLAWIVAATVSALAAGSLTLALVGIVSIVAATLAATRAPHERLYGAMIGLSVGFIAFRLPYDQFHGLATLVAVTIAAPLVLGAWNYGPIAMSRVLSVGFGLLALVSIGSGIGFGVAGLDARNGLEDAATSVDEAIAAFRDGDEAGAFEHLSAAVASLESADAAMTKPWVTATRVLPVIGQHTNALSELSARGASATTATQFVLGALATSSITIVDGAVDLDAVAAVEADILHFADQIIAVEEALGGLRSPWLASPVTAAIGDVEGDLAGLASTAHDARDAIKLAPAMLGADGPRSYLILFATPAELRGSGGLVGNWARVNADDGQISLEEVGRASDLAAAGARAGIELTGPDDYLARFANNDVASHFYDVTLSPNFPDVASVAAQIYTAISGESLDGVMLFDPYAMAALMEITGPVTVADRTIDAKSAPQFMLVDQYEVFASEEERLLFLGQLTEKVFTSLLNSTFPEPWDLDEVFGDVVAQGRLAIASLDPDEQLLLDGLGIGGSFPTVTDDLAGFVTQNAGQNKIDNFFTRSLVYDVELDPATGTLTSTATMRLANSAPATGYVDALIGDNGWGVPFGTNTSQLSFYSPHTLTAVRVDGAEAGAQRVDELGIHSYTTTVIMPPGETAVVKMDFAGPVDLTDGVFTLDIPVQAAVAADQIQVNVTVPDGWRIQNSTTFWSAEVLTSADQHFELVITPA